MALSKELLSFLTVLAAVGAGVIGGVLFAFSNVVMRTLAQQPPESGLRTMQAININILNPLFLLFFLGTALTGVILAMSAFTRLSSPGALPLLIASMLYVVGVLGVTVALNVPLNDKLAALDPTSAQAAQSWRDYVSDWLRWNHVRTAASVLASALFTLSARV